MGFRSILKKALKSSTARDIALAAITGGPGGAAVAIVEKLQSKGASQSDIILALSAAVDDLHTRLAAIEKKVK